MGSPTPNSTLESASATFRWSAGSGALSYAIWVGTTPGGHEVYNSPDTTELSWTVNNLPVDGRTLYVRLFTKFPAGYQHNDYTYKAAHIKATMTSPSPGTTLIGTSTTFQWSAVPAARAYAIWVGRTAGGYEIYNSPDTTELSWTVNNLPADGSTVYIRLFTAYPSVSGYQHNDYTYTAADKRATMTSPAPGATLTGGSVTFSWSAVEGVQGYAIWVGTTPGGHEIHNSPDTAQLSWSVSNLPRDGRTIYIRLFTKVGSEYLYRDYTYRSGP